jgi:hypothetical protein
MPKHRRSTTASNYRLPWLVLALLASTGVARGGGPSPDKRLPPDVCRTCDLQPNDTGTMQFVCSPGDSSPCFASTGACRVGLTITTQDADSTVDSSQVCPNGSACLCDVDADCANIGGTCRLAADGNSRCQSATTCQGSADCAYGAVCGPDGSATNRCQIRCPGSNSTITLALDGMASNGQALHMTYGPFGNCDPGGPLSAFYCPPPGTPDGNNTGVSLCSRSRGRMTEDALTQISAADLDYQTFAPLAASLRQACGVATGVPMIMAATPLAVAT